MPTLSPRAPSAFASIAVASLPSLPLDAARLAGLLTLKDGATIRVRPILPGDGDRLRAFHARLSQDTIVHRFFHYMPELTRADADRFTHLDYDKRMALVATLVSGSEDILAVVRYDRIDDNTAEVAFVVADYWQGHGIATELLCRLATYARSRGITSFVAITMSDNIHMLELLRHCGFPITTQHTGMETEVRLDITASSR